MSEMFLTGEGFPPPLAESGGCRVKLHELSPAAGSKKEVKRIGRGAGSGQGKTAGKGHKGQKARAGRGMRPGYEGCQMPLQRRVPKRGFVNIFGKEFSIVNVSALDQSFEDGAVVDIDALTLLYNASCCREARSCFPYAAHSPF